jgi:hypothetical protein
MGVARRATEDVEKARAREEPAVAAGLARARVEREADEPEVDAMG